MSFWQNYGKTNKKGATEPAKMSVTPCYFWRAQQDSNLRPTDS